MDMKNRIRSIVTLQKTIWTVGEVMHDDVQVESIFEVFHKPVPVYRIEYTNGVWFEIPVSSVEFVSGYMK